MRGFGLGVGLVAAGLWIAAAGTAFAGTLVINSDKSDAGMREGFTQAVEEFKKENPDITVEFNITEKEAYKQAIRGYLTAQSPDVLFWFAGNRMADFVKAGLIDDVSDVWTPEISKDFASTRDSLTFDGKQYAVPFGYYNWGLYYLTDVFEKAGVKPPKTWEEFIAACVKIKAAGITPIAIGTKAPWPAAFWFDYLDLRINGLKFHIDLLNGRESFEDARVRTVFAKWRELVDAGFFLENHTSYGWDEAMPFLINGTAGMYGMGNFITGSFPAGQRDTFSYFPFPIIDPAVPVYEDAPTDTIFIPANAANKADARKFLAFIARPDIQSKLSTFTGVLPANNKSEPPTDKFMKAGAEVLAAAAGTAQYFDRDAAPEMAEAGVQGMQEFMVKPDRLDAILKRLEDTRKRLYKIK